MIFFIFLVVVFIVTLTLTYFVKRWAINKSILDLPNDRSSHTIPTPRGGGIAIAIVWFLAISYLFFNKEIDSTLFFALLCGVPISIIGLVDDIITISPKIRLLIQILSATLALFFLGGINNIDIGFKILYIPFLFTVLSIISIVWFTNLFNFLDGIDGYISTEVIFIGLSFFVFFGISTPLLLAIVTLGFLVWNWQPAKIFMGDVGSTLLGFTIGVFAVYYQNNGTSSIFIWLILSSLFWYDATITLYRRLRRGEKISIAHKKHAYQRMVQSGWSHQQTVFWAQILNLPIIGLAWLGIHYPLLILPSFFINIIYLFFIMRMVDKQYTIY